MQRRAFLIHTAHLIATGLLIPSPVQALAVKKHARKLHLYNIHTGEFFKGEYSDGLIIFPEAQAELNRFLRDWRTDDVHPMDPRLIHLVHDLQKQWGDLDAFDVISGFRSKKTNSTLRKKSKGVAERSLHMGGRAIDIASKNRLQDLRNLAQSIKKGGVGYYPHRGFVHVDIRSKPTFWG